jgi:replicative DNA helicase
MLVNPHFCDVAKSAISVENFQDKQLQYFFDKLSNASIHLTQATLTKYVDLYRMISVPPVPFEEEYINTHMLNFIRLNECKRAIIKSIDLIKTNDWGTIQELVMNAANAGADIMSQGTDYFAEYQDRIARRINREVERKLSTGIPELDEITYGGLKTKQLGLCVGGTGRGKSIFLQWLARVAVLLGKKVVYLTFELSEEDMAERFDSIFAHIKPNGLQDHASEALKRLSKYYDKFGTSLIIKEYPEDTVTVPEVKAYLLQLTAQGFVPDLILVDYIDLIKPHRVYNDIAQEQAAVTKALRGLAKGLNTRIWTAAQVNRSGLAMETPDEASISGSIGKLFTADIAVFMAQTAAEREDQFMRLVVSKNRNGPANRTVKITTDYQFLTLMREEAMGSKEDANGNTVQSNIPQTTGGVLIL